jgi:hypothetical protein
MIVPAKTATPEGPIVPEYATLSTFKMSKFSSVEKAMTSRLPDVEATKEHLSKFP